MYAIDPAELSIAYTAPERAPARTRLEERSGASAAGAKPLAPLALMRHSSAPSARRNATTALPPSSAAMTAFTSPDMTTGDVQPPAGAAASSREKRTLPSASYAASALPASSTTPPPASAASFASCKRCSSGASHATALPFTAYRMPLLPSA
ncbi:hypothetical protein D3C78_873580 [compost metagenome]